MVCKVPVNYRQNFKWIGDLDAQSMAAVAVGGLIALHYAVGTPNPVYLRILLASTFGGLGAVLGFGRYPLEYGDNFWIWMRRYMEYRARPHSFLSIRILTPKQAAAQAAAYDSEAAEIAASSTSRGKPPREAVS